MSLIWKMIFCDEYKGKYNDGTYGNNDDDGEGEEWDDDGKLS